MKDYSEPRMHTAEHLLNQAMVRMFGCGRAFSSHIEKKKSKCDYRFPRDLTGEERAGLEQSVNAAVRADMPVRESFAAKETAAQKYDLKRLPEAAGENLRVISIGDYDACPCIGPHVNSTAEIGAFRIISTGFENGVLRLRFRLETKP
jgi:alanyl-tRNA synthetase